MIGRALADAACAESDAGGEREGEDEAVSANAPGAGRKQAS